MLKDEFCTREGSRCIILRGLRSVRHFGPRVDCPALFVSMVARTTSFQPPTEVCGSLVETLALAAGLPKRTGPRQATATPRMQRLTGYRNSESSTKSQLFFVTYWKNKNRKKPLHLMQNVSGETLMLWLSVNPWASSAIFSQSQHHPIGFCIKCKAINRK